MNTTFQDKIVEAATKGIERAEKENDKDICVAIVRNVGDVTFAFHSKMMIVTRKLSFDHTMIEHLDRVESQAYQETVRFCGYDYEQAKGRVVGGNR